MLTEWSAEGSAGDRAALELALTVTRADDGPVIVLDGGLVSGTADRLIAVADELLDEGAVLTLDLTCLALLDSAGVNVLLRIVERAAGTVDGPATAGLGDGRRPAGAHRRLRRYRRPRHTDR